MLKFLKMSLVFRRALGFHSLILLLDLLVWCVYLLHYLEPLIFGIMVEGVTKGDFTGFVWYLAFSVLVLVLQVSQEWLSSRKIYPEIAHYLRMGSFSRALQSGLGSVRDAEGMFLFIDDVMVFFSPLPASYMGTLVGRFSR